MAEPTGTATNPTEPPPATSDTGAAVTPPATDPGTQQQAPSATTLLGETPKPEGDKPADDGSKPADPPKPEGAPEAYEQFKAPEGKEYDPHVLEQFSTAAKEANLSQDAAQKLLDKVAPALQERQTQQADALKSQWLNDSKSDKEFGGEKIQENLSIAKKSLDTFGSPELRKLLEDTGLGNHPEVIRFFYKSGKAISEDASFVGGNAPAKGGLNAAAVLYDNTRKE